MYSCGIVIFPGHTSPMKAITCRATRKVWQSSLEWLIGTPLHFLQKAEPVHAISPAKNDTLTPTKGQDQRKGIHARERPRKSLGVTTVPGVLSFLRSFENNHISHQGVCRSAGREMRRQDRGGGHHGMAHSTGECGPVPDLGGGGGNSVTHGAPGTVLAP